MFSKKFRCKVCEAAYRHMEDADECAKGHYLIGDERKVYLESKKLLNRIKRRLE